MFFITVFSILFSVLFINKALANPACAVCTIAIGASLGIARRLGLDDNIVAVWLGALLLLAGYWTVLWCDKKNWQFPGRTPLILLISLSTIGVVYVKTLVYTPQPIGILYLDPFLFSYLLGALTLFASTKFYQWLKARHGGHAHFPFEKVVLPVLALSLVSIYLNYFPLNTVNGIAL